MERFLIFISYRRGDSAGYAGRLHESLERRLGEGQVFRDVDGLESGQDFVDSIAARLRDCGGCLVLIGSEWLHATDGEGRRRLDKPDDYVRIEIEAALARSDLLVVPVLVEGVSMPTAEDLPPTIRPLARRHAISLRDETWDSDVDRLVATLNKKVGAALRPPSRRMLLWSGAAAALVAAMLLIPRIARSPDEASPDGSSAGRNAPPRAVPLPRLAEAAHANLIYTVLAADVASKGSENALLRIRVRLSNEGRYQANFWDDSFRLALQGHIIPASGRLNELVDGHAIRQEIVTFELPRDADRATLQIVGRGPAGDIPLDLAAAGGTSTVDTPDTGDALSRAQVFGVVREPVALGGAGKEISYQLVALTARRFVNTTRVIAAVRMENRGRYPSSFGSDAIRLLVDGQLLGPAASPNLAVDGTSTGAGDFVFDVPLAAQRGVLRLPSVPGAELPFELPAGP